MTRLLAHEWAPRIRVNAIAVGATVTDALEFVVVTEELRRQMEEMTPMRRLGQVEDIAAAVLYLASLPPRGSQARCSRSMAAPSPPTGPTRSRAVSRLKIARSGQFTPPQHFLYFFPLPQGQEALRPGLSSARTGPRGRAIWTRSTVASGVNEGARLTASAGR